MNMRSEIFVRLLALPVSLFVLPLALLAAQESRLANAIGIIPIYTAVLSFTTLWHEHRDGKPRNEQLFRRRFQLSIGFALIGFGLHLMDVYARRPTEAWPLTASATCLCLSIQFLFESLPRLLSRRRERSIRPDGAQE